MSGFAGDKGHKGRIACASQRSQLTARALVFVLVRVGRIILGMAVGEHGVLLAAWRHLLRMLCLRRRRIALCVGHGVPGRRTDDAGDVRDDEDGGTEEASRQSSALSNLTLPVDQQRIGYTTNSGLGIVD